MRATPAPVRDPSAAPALFAGLAPKRANLLRAALDLFVEHGFEATSVPAVARRAGMATGTVYLHFRSKRELVNALLTHLRAHVAAQLVAAVDLKAPLRRQFEAIWGVFARHLLEQPAAVAFCDLHHHATYLGPAVLKAWAPAARLLDAHVRQGRRSGRYRDLPDGALRALMAGALLGVSKLARVGEVQASGALLAEVREAVWVGLARPRGARRGPGGAR